MKVLIACEESQTVCKAFRKLGYEAYSCDIQDCSGGYPEWHIKSDAIAEAYSGKYDLMIAHPPCTYLSNSGVSWLYNKDKSKNLDRWENLIIGGLFFKQLLNAPIRFIAVENPIPHKYALEIIDQKYSQLIQPYEFGHPESKATCFWLKELPILMQATDGRNLWATLPKKQSQRIYYVSGKDRQKIRSKTFQGIADAMAVQWGDFVEKQL